MIVAVDLDGTITADPAVYKALMKALYKDGHTVYIMTAVRRPNTSEARQQEKIDNLGLRKSVHYHGVIFIDGGDYDNPVHKDMAGQRKRDKCQALGVSLAIEDKNEWATYIREACRSTLLVV